jgi:hypothetical protein
MNEPLTVTKFWVVWNPAFDIPVVRHQDPQKARAEAERLARANPGAAFFVMGLEGACRASAIEWSFPSEDDIFVVRQ